MPGKRWLAFRSTTDDWETQTRHAIKITYVFGLGKGGDDSKRDGIDSTSLLKTRYF